MIANNTKSRFIIFISIPFVSLKTQNIVTERFSFYYSHRTTQYTINHGTVSDLSDFSEDHIFYRKIDILPVNHKITIKPTIIMASFQEYKIKSAIEYTLTCCIFNSPWYFLWFSLFFSPDKNSRESVVPMQISMPVVLPSKFQEIPV